MWFKKILLITATSTNFEFRFGKRVQDISHCALNWATEETAVSFPGFVIHISPRSMFTEGRVHNSWLFDIRRQLPIPHRRFREEESTSSAILVGHCGLQQDAKPVFEFVPIGKKLFGGIRIRIQSPTRTEHIFRFPWRRKLYSSWRQRFLS